MAHPIVVGFGSGFNISDVTAQTSSTGKKAVTSTKEAVSRTEVKAVRSLDFGWIVAPRSLPQRVYQQIDGQYPLTAFISVPAWWRTAHVVISSCWLARRALSHVNLDQPASKICDQDNNLHTSEIIVRLPPAVPEISRKLAFDVVQQPSLYNPTHERTRDRNAGRIAARGRASLAQYGSHGRRPACRQDNGASQYGRNSGGI